MSNYLKLCALLFSIGLTENLAYAQEPIVQYVPSADEHLFEVIATYSCLSNDEETGESRQFECLTLVGWSVRGNELQVIRMHRGSANEEWVTEFNENSVRVQDIPRSPEQEGLQRTFYQEDPVMISGLEVGRFDYMDDVSDSFCGVPENHQMLIGDSEAMQSYFPHHYLVRFPFSELDYQAPEGVHTLVLSRLEVSGTRR